MESHGIYKQDRNSVQWEYASDCFSLLIMKAESVFLCELIVLRIFFYQYWIFQLEGTDGGGKERKRRKMASDIYATEITDCNWTQTQILLCQCSFTLICNDIFYNNVLHATLFTIARTTPMSIKEWRWKGK